MAKPRIDTSGQGNPLAQNPFAALSATGLPGPAPTPAPAAPAPGSTSIRKQPNLNRGRVDIVRQTAGRGGKTVTVISGFKGIAQRELEDLARAIQRSAGVGGTLKPGSVIEIQGDQRERARTILEAAGFRPILAGG